MFDRKGHGLFLINMLAGANGIDKMLTMQMLRRGDQNRVEILVFEHEAVIDEGLDRGRDGLGSLALFGIDVADGGEFGVGAVEGIAHNLLAARAVADDAETNFAIRSENGFGQGEAANASGDLSEKFAA